MAMAKTPSLNASTREVSEVMELIFYSFVSLCLGGRITRMFGKWLVGIIVGLMILGPYRITGDEKKVEVKKVESPASNVKKELHSRT